VNRKKTPGRVCAVRYNAACALLLLLRLKSLGHASRYIDLQFSYVRLTSLTACRQFRHHIVRSLIEQYGSCDGEFCFVVYTLVEFMLRFEHRLTFFSNP